MKRPIVINLKDKSQSCQVRVCRPSMWGNPFHIGKDGTREDVIEKYRSWILTKKHLLYSLEMLAGKTIGCWCDPLPCHAHLLADMVEQLPEDPERRRAFVSAILDREGRILRRAAERKAKK